jgi:hypothetical protein
LGIFDLKREFFEQYIDLNTFNKWLNNKNKTNKSDSPNFNINIENNSNSQTTINDQNSQTNINNNINIETDKDLSNSYYTQKSTNHKDFITDAQDADGFPLILYELLNMFELIFRFGEQVDSVQQSKQFPILEKHSRLDYMYNQIYHNTSYISQYIDSDLKIII